MNLRNLFKINKLCDIYDPFNNKILAKSIGNCHAFGVDSIVLSESDNCLTRLFLAWPEHELYKNLNLDGCFSVGPHNHKYNLTIDPVCGKVYNLEFVVEDPLGYYQLPVDSYIFHSAIDSIGVASYLDKVKLNWISCDLIQSSCPLTHCQFHTIYVPKGEKAAWLVYEGQRVDNKTQVFNNSPINLKELYQNLTVDDVICKLEKFFIF